MKRDAEFVAAGRAYAEAVRALESAMEPLEAIKSERKAVLAGFDKLTCEQNEANRRDPAWIDAMRDLSDRYQVECTKVSLAMSRRGSCLRALMDLAELIY